MFFLNLIIIILACAGAIYSYYNFQQQPGLAVEFACGFLFGIFIMNIWLIIKNKKINTYKRALEKEAVSSSESSSRVKVLEEKIKVLEKALTEAINR